MWYWVILKKSWETERGLETSFGTPYQKSAHTLKFVFTHVSYINQQKKVNTISHVRQTKGLTKIHTKGAAKTSGTFRLKNILSILKLCPFLNDSYSEQAKFLTYLCMPCNSPRRCRRLSILPTA